MNPPYSYFVDHAATALIERHPRTANRFRFMVPGYNVFQCKPFQTVRRVREEMVVVDDSELVLFKRDLTLAWRRGGGTVPRHFHAAWVRAHFLGSRCCLTLN